jgi:hypothetical protein
MSGIHRRSFASRNVLAALCLTIALNGFAVAGEPDLPDAPRATDDVATTGPAEIDPVIRVSAAGRKRVIDKRFWSLVAYDVALTQIDVQTTMWSLRNSNCTEGLSAAVVGTRPTMSRLQTTALASNAGLAVISYWMKRRGHQKWWIVQFASGTAHAGAAAWNHAGSGCY